MPRTSESARAMGVLTSLTPRESEVLELLAEVSTASELAKRLFVSTRTVESHLSHAYRKLGVRSRPDALEAYAAMKKAAEGPMKGILAYTEEELVSIDFRGNPHSAIVDAGYTRVVGQTCAKVMAWYDNEWGYSCRVRDLIKFVAAKL